MIAPLSFQRGVTVVTRPIGFTLVMASTRSAWSRPSLRSLVTVKEVIPMRLDPFLFPAGSETTTDVGPINISSIKTSLEGRVTASVTVGPVVFVKLPIIEAGNEDRHEEIKYVLTSGEGVPITVIEVI